MKRPPFKITHAHGGVFRRDGKFVVGGRISWAWLNLVTSIACGVEGTHEIRRGNGPWHTITMTIEEAEQALNPDDDFFGRKRVAHARRFRARKEARV